MPVRTPMETTYSQVLDPMGDAPSEKIVKRDVDGAFIPFDEGNLDYQDYLAWLKKGNKPKPPENPAAP